MAFYENERTAVLIDGPNFFACAKSLGLDIDFRSLREYFQQRCILVRTLYYTPVSEDREPNSIKPLIDWLEYNGFTLITKPKKEFVDSSGRRKVKGSTNVELAVDAVRLAPSLDHLVVLSGDGDFRAAVQAIQEMGKRVSVISTLKTQPPMVADDLRRQADQFIDLIDLEPIISRVAAK